MYRVMLVDDVEIMRRQIRQMDLWGGKSGFEIVSEAEDGLDALEMLNNSPVDLLITDIGMPRINGLELLKEVYENDLAGCVVFLSEYREFSYAKEAIQYDIFDYLVKPVDYIELKQLLTKVDNHLKVKKNAQDMYYPNQYIIKIVDAVISGDDIAIGLTLNMIESVNRSFNHALDKTVVVLDKAIDEIIQHVVDKFPWLEQFINIQTLKASSLSRCLTLSDLEEQCVYRVNMLLETFEKLLLKTQNKTLARNICEFIAENIDRGVGIAMISEALFLTKNYLGEVFKKELDITLSEHIIGVKILRAKHLIIYGNLKIYEISDQLGYSDAEYFSRIFKKYTGYTPKDYKQHHSNPRNFIG